MRATLAREGEAPLGGRDHPDALFSPNGDRARLAPVRRSLGILSAFVVAASLLVAAGRPAFADDPAAGVQPALLSPASPTPATAEQARAPDSILPEAPLEAPPPPPRRNGVVIESRLGALAFLGDFRHIAPTAPWWHVDVGYEFIRQLAVFGYGEISFTDTSELQSNANNAAFPIYGFGGGVRGTVHATPRVAFFLEGDVGAMRADVPRGTLELLGFANAETFGLALGGRVGVEWYQVDRHLAFGLDVGVRDALGFAEQFVGTGPPLMLDASGAIRYTF